jgi:hypothetical protein
MIGLWIALGIVGALIILSLLTALICFFRVFYFPTRKPLPDGEYDIPEGGSEEFDIEGVADADECDLAIE